MTRIITLVLFLLLSRDDASSTVVVFYRDVMSMPRLHATTEWGKKARIFLIRYSYPRAIYTRTKREEEKEHHQ